jgi:AcrR family transcriptional regulator
VLDAAMATFWRKGYAATSLDDLTEAMGIRRSSLYGAYEGKEALFRRAIDRYAETRLVPLLAALDEGTTIEDGLRAFGRRLAELVAGDPATTGCLVTCVLADAAGDDAAMREILRARFDTLEATFVARLARAVEEGELCAETDVVDLAAVLVSVARGLTLRARAGAPRQELLRTFDAVVAMVLAAHGTDGGSR